MKMCGSTRLHQCFWLVPQNGNLLSAVQILYLRRLAEPFGPQCTPDDSGKSARCVSPSDSERVLLFQAEGHPDQEDYQVISPTDFEPRGTCGVQVSQRSRQGLCRSYTRAEFTMESTDARHAGRVLATIGESSQCSSLCRVDSTDRTRAGASRNSFRTPRHATIPAGDTEVQMDRFATPEPRSGLARSTGQCCPLHPLPPICYSESRPR